LQKILKKRFGRAGKYTPTLSNLFEISREIPRTYRSLAAGIEVIHNFCGRPLERHPLHARETA